MSMQGYFDVLTLTPAANLLERLSKKTWKTAFKMALENPQNYIAKKYQKNMKLSSIFSDFRGLNYLSYNLFEATFQQSVFPKL